ncbi:MAG: hypothetical protein WAQ22_04135 [Candidatus Saccharimonas sp.]
MEVLAMNPPRISRTVPEINNIKDNMSRAFMHSLNSTVNYHLEESSRAFDNLGIDLRAFNLPQGKSRQLISEENEIRLQMKGVSVTSSSKFSEDENSITYNLSENLIAIGTHYLIVVVMPADKEIDTWRDIDEESVRLWARAYYVLIDGQLTKGKITIPKSNILNPDTYAGLFEAAKNKDAL